MDPKPDIQQVLEHRKGRRTSYADCDYVRLMDEFRGLPRGTALFDHGTVYGYPRIGRFLNLQTGLSEHFDGPVWAEEKVDGYNVRIFRVGACLLALTRGGFACPFTTDRLPDLLDPAIFDDHPDLVVCAEVAGPETPYMEGGPPFIAEDVELFVFDLMRWDRPGFLPQAQKHRLLERYGLPAVAMYGRYDHRDLSGIQQLLVRLNEEGREGVVFKEEAGDGHRAKYVTSNSSVADIRVTAYNILDLPPEYFTNRILRLALFLEEQGLERSPQLSRALGDAFLGGLVDAIRQYEAEQKVYRTFRCRFREKANAEQLIEHLEGTAGHQVQIKRRELRQEGGYWVLEFDRVYPGMNGLLSHLLSGGLVFD